METEKLKRKVFLLSSYEVDAPESPLQAEEGKRLQFFSDVEESEVWIAYTKGGEAGTYWLRTAEIWDDYTVTSVSGADGAVGALPVEASLAVRPVFTVEADTPVFKKELPDFGMIYVIE